MKQLTKQEIVKKTGEFLTEIKVLCANVNKTKKWIDMAVCTEPGLSAMEERFDEEIKLAEDKVAEFRKFEKENPFDDAPMEIN